MWFKDAIKEVAELGVHASELDKAKDRSDDEDVHEEGLVGYRPDNFSDGYW